MFVCLFVCCCNNYCCNNYCWSCCFVFVSSGRLTVEKLSLLLLLLLFYFLRYAVVLHSLIVQGLSLPRFFRSLFSSDKLASGGGGTGDGDEQMSWLSAEKDDILFGLKQSMDTSPLLRQMLEEQGIAREHLVRRHLFFSSFYFFISVDLFAENF